MKTVAINRYATYEYEILEKHTAGIVLSGEEIKSVRSGNMNIKDSYGVVSNGEIMLLNCHIGKYSHSFATANEDERRSRKLLLTKKEIRRLIGYVSQKGLTLIPLKAFFSSSGYLKIQLGVAKHKKVYDKRRQIKERELERDTKRELKKFQ